MIEIKVKFCIGDRVSIDGEGKYKVVGYELIDGRGLRYILLNNKEYLYQYEPELEETKANKIGFVKV